MLLSVCAFYVVYVANYGSAIGNVNGALAHVRQPILVI